MQIKVYDVIVVSNPVLLLHFIGRPREMERKFDPTFIISSYLCSAFWIPTTALHTHFHGGEEKLAIPLSRSS